jgi:hypothetical protein
MPLRPALARFGPLRLVEAISPATRVAPGAAVPVDLSWQVESVPGEPVVVVLQLVDDAGHVVAGLEEEPLQGSYPATEWTAAELVRDRHTLNLPSDLEEGEYDLVAGLYRAADRERYRNTVGLFGSTVRHIKRIAVER